MKREPRWIPKDVVLAIQEALLAEHGGSPGVRDMALLESALSAPRNLFAYESTDLFRLAAAYAHAITRNHPFIDGNKRVALTVVGVFLEINGSRLEAGEADAVAAIMALSTHDLEEDAFAAWLRKASRSIRPARRSRRRGRSR